MQPATTPGRHCIHTRPMPAISITIAHRGTSVDASRCRLSEPFLSQGALHFIRTQRVHSRGRLVAPPSWAPVPSQALDDTASSSSCARPEPFGPLSLLPTAADFSPMLRCLMLWSVLRGLKRCRCQGCLSPRSMHAPHHLCLRLCRLAAVRCPPSNLQQCISPVHSALSPVCTACRSNSCRRASVWVVATTWFPS